MEKLIGLKTEIGFLKGRDAIFLNRIVFDTEKKVRLIGEFSLNETDRNFEMTFDGVIYFIAVELDFDDRAQMESFGTIKNSAKLELFRSRDHSQKTNNEHRHYYIRTYDTVFEIISGKFELMVNV
jgi:hypothetical protein